MDGHNFLACLWWVICFPLLHSVYSLRKTFITRLHYRLLLINGVPINQNKRYTGCTVYVSGGIICRGFVQHAYIRRIHVVWCHVRMRSSARHRRLHFRMPNNTRAYAIYRPRFPSDETHQIAHNGRSSVNRMANEVMLTLCDYIFLGILPQFETISNPSTIGLI